MPLIFIGLYANFHVVSDFGTAIDLSVCA